MSGFVAGTPTADLSITNDGFWPNIDGDDLRAAQRIETAVTNERLKAAIVAAIIASNRELVSLKARYLGEGHATLADVPAAAIGGESPLVATYRRAIYSATSAEVAERYRTYDATNSGTDKADEERTTIDDYRRDARFALRDLLGVSRTTVELL